MITIRTAKIADHEELGRMNIELMKDHIKNYGKVFEIGSNALKISKNWAKKTIYNPRMLVLVAESDGKLIGYAKAAIKRRPPIYKVRDWGSVDSIYVRPRYRRKGIAKDFFKEFLKWYKKKGVKYTDLHAAPQNKAAIKMWHRFGFRDHLTGMYRKV